MSESKAAIVYVDGKPHYELNATELVFRIATANPLKPIYFHMRPYTAHEMKETLAGLKGKIRDAGATIISEDADPAPLYRLFDQTFRRLSNVATADGGEPSLDQQRAFLDRDPRLKARVIQEGFCVVFFRKRNSSDEPAPGIGVNGRPLEQPVVLDDLLVLDEGAAVEYIILLQTEDKTKADAIDICHRFDVETPRDYQLFARASRREMEKTSGCTTMDVDYDALERLYDRAILSVDGMLVDGDPCTEANRKAWLAKIPLFHKKVALDARFEDVTQKNV